MGKYTAHLRYTIGDPLEAILGNDLDAIGKAYGVDISFERIDKRVFREGMMREETLDKPMEEISQEVITVRSDEEKAFRKTIEAVYEKYRSPRTPYGFWGSSRDGERIAKAIADKTGGGW